jgi:glyoxylase-like metal-dependent hydrolase (beta-lactamase superfamily II)
MKRALKWLAVVVMVAVSAAGFVWFSAFANNKPLTDGEQLAPGVVTVKDRFVSMFLLDTGPGKVALIDAGLDDAALALQAALRRRGLPREAVTAIFLTHGHGDHTAGCKQFPGVDVYAMANEISLVGDAAQVNHPMKDGEVVQLGDLALQAFAVPGHTPGSAVFLARGVLFFGDSAGASKDGSMRKAVRLFSKDSSQNVASLKALEARLAPRAAEIKKLAFGHAGSLDGFEPFRKFATEP